MVRSWSCTGERPPAEPAGRGALATHRACRRPGCWRHRRPARFLVGGTVLWHRGAPGGAQSRAGPYLQVKVQLGDSEARVHARPRGAQGRAAPELGDRLRPRRGGGLRAGRRSLALRRRAGAGARRLPPSRLGAGAPARTLAGARRGGVRASGQARDALRAAASLRHGDFGRVVLCYGFGEQHPSLGFKVQSVLHDLRLVTEAVLPGFNRYQGAEAIGAASALYVCRPTRRSRPDGQAHLAAGTAPASCRSCPPTPSPSCPPRWPARWRRSARSRAAQARYSPLAPPRSGGADHVPRAHGRTLAWKTTHRRGSSWSCPPTTRPRPWYGPMATSRPTWSTTSSWSTTSPRTTPSRSPSCSASRWWCTARTPATAATRRPATTRRWPRTRRWWSWSTPTTSTTPPASPS